MVMADKERVLLLRAELRQCRQELSHHAHCDDCWYCCGKCQHPDHFYAGKVIADEYPLGKGANGRESGVCNCGADRIIARIDAVMKETAYADDTA